MKKKPEIIEIPKRKLLAASGEGQPGCDLFQTLIGALFTMGWSIKMKRKFAGEETFKVAQLEGIYQSMTKWTLAIEVPDYITAAEVKKTAAELIAKGKPETVRQVSILSEKKQRCVQMLHIGPYDDVCPTLEAMTAFAATQGLAMQGPHREIYYSDPGRVAPEKLKTVLRHPVSKL
jgi:hypothetical protein